MNSRTSPGPEGFAVIAYGENASDAGDFRPGAKAAGEFQVRAPLKDAGLTKAEIRELSAQLGLPTADKPQMACLSSRIPHGEPVNTEKLRMIEAAENVLRDLGFHDVRVRHHEMRVKSDKWQVTEEITRLEWQSRHPSLRHLSLLWPASRLGRRKCRDFWPTAWPRAWPVRSRKSATRT